MTKKSPRNLLRTLRGPNCKPGCSAGVAPAPRLGLAYCGTDVVSGPVVNGFELAVVVKSSVTGQPGRHWRWFVLVTGPNRTRGGGNR